MLSIEASKNVDAAIRYFSESLSVEDYYSEKSEITGQWHGFAAQQLGLLGDVKAQDFTALLNNINPMTGKKLTARNSKNRRPMYDFTFNAPKSVSLIHAMTGDEDVLQAHRAASLKVMRMIEEDMQTQMGSGKGKHYLTTGNMMFAEFIHTTTRPMKHDVAGKAHYVPDPHLHSHCAVVNATWCEKQKRYRAIEIGNIKGQASYYEAMYHAYLAQNLKAVGYDIHRSGKRWEIAGLSRALIEKFSSRTLEIEAEAIKRGITSEKSKARLGRLTRKRKNNSIANDQLSALWLSRLSDAEYDAIFYAKQDKKSGEDKSTSLPRTSMSKLHAKNFINLALDHFLERQSVVSEKKLLAFALDQAGTACLPEQLRLALHDRKDIYHDIRNTVKYITTEAIVHEEEKLISRANASRNMCHPIHAHYQIQNPILNQGQRLAVQHCLTHPDRLLIVAGDAGVGKTTLLSEVKSGIEATGKTLFAFAPSADAAKDVLRSKGFEKAETIAKLLHDEKLQAQLQDQVILIDEAGLIGVLTMNKLLDIADHYNARVILSGDWKQHSAVERGDALRILETKTSLSIARVSEIVRQQGAAWYKKIIERVAQSIGVKHQPAWRKAEVIQAFCDLDQRGSIAEISDQDQRYQMLADDYMRESDNNSDDVLVVAPTHREGAALTTVIRANLKATERLAQDEQCFTRLQSKQYTQAQKSLSDLYQIGDVIEFHKNMTGFKAGQRYRVNTITDQGDVMVTQDGQHRATPLTLSSGDRFDIYSEESIKIAVGDRLRITKNSRSLDNASLHNGQRYTVTGFDDQGHIILSNGQTLNKEAGHFAYGYVSTSHAAQGKDAKVVLIAQSAMSFAASNDKQFYVSISRGTQSCRIYTDDKDGLRRAISENGDHLSATELAAEKQRVQDEEDAYWEEINDQPDYWEWLHTLYEGIKNIFNTTATKVENDYEQNFNPTLDKKETCGQSCEYS